MDTILTQLTEFCGGITTTSTSETGRVGTAIEGRWIDTDTGEPVVDANVLIFADVLRDPTDPTLLSYLDKLKERCQRDFRQQVVWITVNPVARVSTADYVY